MQFRFNLVAGIPQNQETAGRMFVLESTGAAPTLAVTLYNGSEEIETIDAAQRGFSARLLEGSFTRVRLLSTVDTSASIIISKQNLALDFVSGSNVNAIIAGLPLPVSNDRGSPGNLMYVSGVTIDDAPAVAVADAAAVAVGAFVTAIAAANANRRELRLSNIGADAVAIGGGSIAWANRVVVLNPGDVWVETRGANLAWSGVCDTGKTASVTAQEVTA